MIPIFVGYDTREIVCYHVAVSSLTRLSTVPLAITPLNLPNIPYYKETHRDSSTTSSYTRFLIPYMMNYTGWAIYVDCDIVCKEDINNLWKLRDDTKALMCVKHDYKTKVSTKFLNNVNSNYKKKNWSSVMLINCGHPAVQILTPEFVQESSGETLHQFKWLDESLVGSFPIEWNWLVGEYSANQNASILHYTLGAPCFKEYQDCDHAHDWISELQYITR